MTTTLDPVRPAVAAEGDAVPAEAVRACARDETRRLVEGPGDRLILDLVRPGLRPHFAGGQLADQLGLEVAALLEDLPPVLLPENGVVEARHVGSWIDLELFGDSAWILADRLAAAIAKRAPDVLVVLMPPEPDELVRGDALILARTARAVHRRGGAVVLGYPGRVWPLPPALGIRAEVGAKAALDTRLPAATGMARIGGGLAPEQARKLELLGLGGAEPIRRPDGALLFAAVDRLGKPAPLSAVAAGFLEGWDWLGLPLLAEDRLDAATLCGFAWRALAARDGGLGCRLADLAVRRFPDDAAAQLCRSSIHIIEQDYAAVAAGPGAADEPGVALGRAWGKALGDDPAMAWRHFAEACRTAAEDALGLYLRNIAALAAFRCGERREAWRLQREIAAALDRGAVDSPHLVFLNRLNMGRLARAEGRSGEARGLIETAFAARAGQLSEHDHFYRAILLAGLDAPDGGDGRPSDHLLEAAAVFAVQDHPDAIPRRTFRSLTGRPLDPLETGSAAVADALGQQLGRAAARGGRVVRAGRGAWPLGGIAVSAVEADPAIGGTADEARGALVPRIHAALARRLPLLAKAPVIGVHLPGLRPPPACGEG